MVLGDQQRTIQAVLVRQSHVDPNQTLQRFAIYHEDGRSIDFTARAINVSDYGAALDGVTDDTAAWQSANDILSAVGGGVIQFPYARSVIAGQVTLSPGVSIAGMATGPFDVGKNPATNTIAPTFLITNTVTTPFVMASRDTCIQDVVVHYPNQVAPTAATPTSYPATFSTPAGSAGCIFRRITLTNAYKGFDLKGGRHVLEDINAGCYANVWTTDQSLDVIHYSRIVASPFWDNAAALNYPQTIDTWVAANLEVGIFYRADGHVLNDIFGFNGKTGLKMLDALSGSPLNSYGYGSNISFDQYVNAIVCTSTRNVGWQFTNLGAGTSSAPIDMNGSVGATKLRIRGGTFWGGNITPLNTSGGLDIEGVENYNPRNVQGVPGMPASGVTQASPFPYRAMVCVKAPTGVTISSIKIGPTNDTGLVCGPGQSVTVMVAANQGINLTYSGGSPTWAWFGL